MTFNQLTELNRNHLQGTYKGQDWGIGDKGLGWEWEQGQSNKQQHSLQRGRMYAATLA